MACASAANSSTEHKAMNECRVLLISTIAQDPHSVADKMVSKFLLADDVRDQLGLRTITNRVKARLIVDVMTTRVRDDKLYFDTFLQMLKEAGPWTGDLVTSLSDSRKKFLDQQPASGARPQHTHSSFPDLNVRVLTTELKTMTDPIQLGIGLNIEPHILDTIQKDNRFDIGGQKKALFSYIADNHKELGITWETIADSLRDFVNKGNLALEIERKLGTPQV